MTPRYLSCSFLILSILFSLHAFSQATVPVLKKNIITTKTSSHQLIPGTRVFMVVPPDFEPMNGASGFQKGLGTALLIQDFDNASFEATAAYFTKEFFREKGVDIKNMQDLTLNGIQAKCAIGKKTEKDNAIVLLYGDSSFATVITIFYPAGDSKTEATMIKCLESTWHDKSLSLPGAVSPFSVDENGSRFKFYNTSAGMQVYTIGGVDIVKDPGVPMAIFSLSPAKITKSNLLKAYTQGVFDSYSEKSGSGFIVRASGPVTINGSEAYEIVAVGKENQKDVLIYTCVFSANSFTLTMAGIAKRELDATTGDFKVLARAVKLKQ